jgi:hypothetical protein
MFYWMLLIFLRCNSCAAPNWATFASHVARADNSEETDTRDLIVMQQWSAMLSKALTTVSRPFNFFLVLFS